MNPKSPITGLALATALALTTLTAAARDFVILTVPITGGMSNLLSATGTTSSNSLTQTSFQVPQNVPWNLMMPNYGTNFLIQAAGSNTVYGFDLSDDGITWTANQPLNATNVQGTNAQAYTVLFPSSAATSYRYARLGKLTTSGTNQIIAFTYYVVSYQ